MEEGKKKWRKKGKNEKEKRNEESQKRKKLRKRKVNKKNKQKKGKMIGRQGKQVQISPRIPRHAYRPLYWGKIIGLYRKGSKAAPRQRRSFNGTSPATPPLNMGAFFNMAAVSHSVRQYL